MSGSVHFYPLCAFQHTWGHAVFAYLHKFPNTIVTNGAQLIF